MPKVISIMWRIGTQNVETKFLTVLAVELARLQRVAKGFAFSPCLPEY